jgi:hypothetical protein
MVIGILLPIFNRLLKKSYMVKIVFRRYPRTIDE